MLLPSLSIIIPTFNARPHLDRCLTSVRRHAPPGTQVIVVDDASTDGTSEWLGKAHPWVELIVLPHNQGFCRAVNVGVSKARGEIIELLNDDTEVCPGWATAALRHFSDPGVGSVAPLVLFMDRPHVIDSAGQEYHICGWGRNRGYNQLLSEEYKISREVFGPSGSSGFYRRSAWERAGGLLPEYGAYCEDIDLAFRLRWAGYRSIYEPASRILHKGSASYGRQPEQVVRLLARNEELVYWINLPIPQLFFGLLPHLGFQAIRALRKVASGQWAPFFAGKIEALRRGAWVCARRRELRRLARERPQKRRLAISTSPRVLLQGWTWMRFRKVAY